MGDRVLLKVSTWRGMICFGKCGKLNPRNIRPFEILARIGPVAYRLWLLQYLNNVQHTFHMSNLKKCMSKEIEQQKYPHPENEIELYTHGEGPLEHQVRTWIHQGMRRSDATKVPTSFSQHLKSHSKFKFRDEIPSNGGMMWQLTKLVVEPSQKMYHVWVKRHLNFVALYHL